MVTVIWENIALKHYLIHFYSLPLVSKIFSLIKLLVLILVHLGIMLCDLVDKEKYIFDAPLLQMSWPSTTISQIFPNKISASSSHFLLSQLLLPTFYPLLHHSYQDASFQPPVKTSEVKWIPPGSSSTLRFSSMEWKYYTHTIVPPIQHHQMK